MILDLTKLLESGTGRQAFSHTLELPGVQRWNEPLFASPVQVTGQAENHNGVVAISYTADFIPNIVCDRCLTALHDRRQMEFAHAVVLSLNHEENDEYIVIPDGKLDLAELVSTDILLEFPITSVCDAGCKGLCPVCGKNLNEGSCGCETKTADPRFAKLRDLLQDN